MSLGSFVVFSFYFFPTFWWIPEACCAPFRRRSLPHSRKNTKKNLRPPPTMEGGLNFGFLKLSKLLASLKCKLELQNVYERNFLGYSYFTYNKKLDMLLSSRELPMGAIYILFSWLPYGRRNASIIQTNVIGPVRYKHIHVSSLAKARCNKRDYT